MPAVQHTLDSTVTSGLLLLLLLLLLLVLLVLLQALYDNLITEKAHNSRLYAELVRHKRRADAAEAALQKQLQVRSLAQ
jgi:hypothetical protein